MRTGNHNNDPIELPEDLAAALEKKGNILPPSALKARLYGIPVRLRAECEEGRQRHAGRWFSAAVSMMVVLIMVAGLRTGNSDRSQQVDEQDTEKLLETLLSYEDIERSMLSDEFGMEDL